MLTKHNFLFLPKHSPYLYQHHYSHHINLFTILLNNQLTTTSLVFLISIPQTQIFLQFLRQSRPHQENPNQKSKSQSLHPKIIFKFQKILLKQLLNLRRKTRLQLTNTIISRLITKTVAQIQPQRKIYPP